MLKPLTAAAVAKFRPGTKRRRIRDGGMRALFLIVEPSGHKSFQMRFRVNGGRIGKMTLGPADVTGTEMPDEPVIGMPLTLAAARQLAVRVHRERALGRDPVAEHKAAKERQRAAVVELTNNTFAAVAKEYIEKHAATKISRWKERARLLGWQPTADGSLELIKGGLAQRWSDKPISKVDGHDIHTVVAETRERGAPGLERRSDQPTESRAHAMLATLSAMYGWLHQHRRVETNPCSTVHRPSPPQARERVLSTDEIKAFWQTSEALGMPSGAVLRLLLLTGARLSEIEELRRDELSADGTQINLPGSRTKNGRAHVILLAPLAREIIGNLPQIPGRYVFSSNGGETPISIGSKIKARLDQAMGNPPEWRIHDLRRTCASGMQRLGVRAEVIERCLNHVSGSYHGVAGIYQRDPMFDETSAAFERWSGHVSGIVSGKKDNITDITAARSRKRRSGR